MLSLCTKTKDCVSHARVQKLRISIILATSLCVVHGITFTNRKNINLHGYLDLESIQVYFLRFDSGLFFYF